MVNSNREKSEQKNDIKIEYCLALGSGYLNRPPLYNFFHG
jgi:hypothetical protein